MYLWSLQTDLQLLATYFYAFIKADLILPRVGGFTGFAEPVSHRALPGRADCSLCCLMLLHKRAPVLGQHDRFKGRG